MKKNSSYLLLKPTDNIVRLSSTWLQALLGQSFTTPDGKEWIIDDYHDEQLWFVSNHPFVSLGEQYMERGNPSLSN